MINESQRCKMVTLLKSLKKYLCTNITDSHSRIHVTEFIFKSNKHIYEVRF